MADFRTPQPFGPFPADDDAGDGFDVHEFSTRVEVRTRGGVFVRRLSHDEIRAGVDEAAALTAAMSGACDVGGWIYLQCPDDDNFNTEIRIALPPGFPRSMTPSSLREVLLAVLSAVEMSARQYEPYFLSSTAPRELNVLPV